MAIIEKRKKEDSDRFFFIPVMSRLEAKKEVATKTGVIPR
jgi:hypothetical protein